MRGGQLFTVGQVTDAGATSDAVIRAHDVE